MRARPPRVLPLLLTAALLLGPAAPAATAATNDLDAYRAKLLEQRKQQITPEQREAAADRRKAQQLIAPQGLDGKVKPSALPTPGPGGVPDVFGTTPNWAYSPLLRKFVDTLPGVGAGKANDLGQYIPVAKPDTKTYPGSDYYEIELRQYTEKMHADLPPTTLRGYVQVNKGTDGAGNNTLDPDPIHYLGPFIQATKDRPVRIKFTNKLPNGAGGNLFLPVDTTVMGAGMGPLGMDTPAGQPMNYTENRATLHLHGGKTVWISDGTPHQWITPAGENTPYPKGVSVKNVPDMPDPGPGSMTFYYSNQQSARFMFYHDHTYGITRLNVYAGEAAGYDITDDAEKKLIADGTIPADQIPLIVQDKTYVDAATISNTDPTWNWGTTPGTPHTGDLWFPHVYMPNQNPYDVSGANAVGRWDYAEWFWPPVKTLSHPSTSNPYYDPINAPWEPPKMPATPNPSAVMEAFNDTPIVNGTAYPSLTVDAKSYRFRILNASDDRFWNLQIFQADTSTVSADNRTLTEVKMATATPTPGWPAEWPTDGRDGGVPDPSTVGPPFVQFANESGFLPKPVVVNQQPVDWNRNMKDFTFGNVIKHSLLLGPAERADVVVDFSKYAGQTLLVYNDAPAAFPARDPRLDYYTGNPDQTDTGGTKSTEVGYGPNTRTVMQIKVNPTPVAPAFDAAKLDAAFASTAGAPGVFASSQNPVIIPTKEYDSAYNKSFTSDGYVRIQDNAKAFTTVDGVSLNLPLEPKAIHDEMGAVYDSYGRMMGKLGTELPGTTAITQQFTGFDYQDPVTEVMQDSMTPMSPVQGDGTQIWKITHNGVDTHAMHFHLFDVQLINRVGWDGAIRTPDPNELGWKDTVRVNPLEDTIVAMRPVAPKATFGVPDSIRPLDPTMPIGSTEGFTGIDPLTGQAVTVTNQLTNFGWEYMWHCHLLSHEEMDMMRPVSLLVDSQLATEPVVTLARDTGGITVNWTDATPANDPATFGNPANEIGFRVERAVVGADGVVGPYSVVGTGLANETSLRDATAVAGTVYSYRVVAFNAAGDAPSRAVVTDRVAVRVFGADRYSTAVAAAKDAFPNWGKVKDIVIASGADPQVDALAAAGLAKAYGGPVLLSPPTFVPASLSEAIDQAGVKRTVKLHVVGNTLDAATKAALLKIPGVDPTLDIIAGSDRYNTSQEVARRMRDVMGPRQAVFFVNGETPSMFLDAAMASDIAAAKGFPTLLVRKNFIPAGTLQTVAYVGATEKYIVGSNNNISDKVATDLGVSAANRWAGSDRYLTSVAVANNAAAKGWLSKTIIGIAQSVPDAISGGSGTGAKGGVLQFTTLSTLPAVTRDFLAANKAGIVDCKVYGSSAAVSNGVITAINTAIK